MVYTMKQARLLSGKTQRQVAQNLGIHAQTYAKMESDPGSVTITQAIAFSQAVGVPLDEIFFAGTQLKVDSA